MHDIVSPASGFVQSAIWSPPKALGLLTSNENYPATLDEVPLEMRVQDKLCSTFVHIKSEMEH